MNVNELIKALDKEADDHFLYVYNQDNGVYLAIDERNATQLSAMWDITEDSISFFSHNGKNGLMHGDMLLETLKMLHNRSCIQGVEDIYVDGELIGRGGYRFVGSPAIYLFKREKEKKKVVKVTRKKNSSSVISSGLTFGNFHAVLENMHYAHTIRPWCIEYPVRVFDLDTQEVDILAATIGCSPSFDEVYLCTVDESYDVAASVEELWKQADCVMKHPTKDGNGNIKDYTKFKVIVNNNKELISMNSSVPANELILYVRGVK